MGNTLTTIPYKELRENYFMGLSCGLSTSILVYMQWYYCDECDVLHLVGCDVYKALEPVQLSEFWYEKEDL